MDHKKDYRFIFVIFLFSLIFLTQSILLFLSIFSFFLLILGLFNPHLALPILESPSRKTIIKVFIPVFILSSVLSPRSNEFSQKVEGGNSITASPKQEESQDESQKKNAENMKEATRPTDTPTPTDTPEPTMTPSPTRKPTNTPHPTRLPTSTPWPTTPPVAPIVESNTSGYVCNCSKTCPNLSCDEAYFQLNQCGCSQRDGDDDGVPCEAQCR